MAGDQHSHDEKVHDHEHMHVTHYLRPEEEWVHLTANHTHDHNHARLTHAHAPYEEMDKEHGREAHIHDHLRPDESPA
jgi:hypothetical protein